MTTTITPPPPLPEVAAPIAEHLGVIGDRGWAVDPDGVQESEITLTGPCGQRLKVSRESYRSGPAGHRLTIRGLLPTELTHHVASRDDNPVVSVDGRRPPEQVARDIHRRVLPRYALAVQAARLRWVEEYALEQMRDDLAARVAAALGAAPPIPDRRDAVVRMGDYHHRPEARFTVPRGAAEVAIALTLPAELVMPMAEFLGPLLRQHRPAEACEACGAPWYGLRDAGCDPICADCGAAVQTVR